MVGSRGVRSPRWDPVSVSPRAPGSGSARAMGPGGAVADYFAAEAFAIAVWRSLSKASPGRFFALALAT